MQQDEKYMVTLILATRGGGLRERLNKHKYDAKNRSDNNELAFQIHK